MANTALLGDNHGMFHQVEPVGPFEGGTLGVPASSELAPLADGSGDWAVTHSGRALFRAPFSDYRASVLWKADIYASEAERVELAEDRLSLAELCRIFNRDLAERDAALRVDLSRIQDPSLPSELAEFYPEATPLAAGKSMFDPN